MMELRHVQDRKNNMSDTLPSFDDPPVVEVVLAVQFEPLTELRTPQIGLLWSAFRDRLPRIEEHAPLDPVMEKFGVKGPPKGSVRFEMLQRPPVPRCWFLNEAGTEIIQVQQDRFIHNWRKVGEGDEYKRYDHERDAFKNDLELFEEFLHREKVGVLVPNQCEVSYVNHILPGAGWAKHGDLSQVVTLFSSEYSEDFLPDLEEARLSCSYVIRGGDGQPQGRLHVTVEPAYRRSDDQPIFVLRMMARGRPDGPDIEGVLRFMDTAREWVVRGFAAVTTTGMHKVWRRRHGS